MTYADPKVRLVHQRQYRAAHPEYSQMWAKAHPEQKRQNDLRWSIANPQKVLDSGARWRKTHPEVVRQKSARRRALKRQTQISIITPIDIAAKWAYWGGLCWMCGARAT